MPAENLEPEYRAEHTIAADQLARLKGDLKVGDDGIERFHGRPTIGRDTYPIEGHVDIRSWQVGAEAIVIDSVSRPEPYQQLRATIDEKIKVNGRDEVGVLRSIYESVLDTMDYDLDFINKEADGLTGRARKVNLADYLQSGKGVCRHMGLAAAWSAGDLIADGLLDGRATSDVNEREIGTKRDAHQWARHESADGTIYIMDPAQEFFGTLEETLDRVTTGDVWEYFRPGEKEEYLARRRGSVVIKEVMGIEQAIEADGEPIMENYTEEHGKVIKYAHKSQDFTNEVQRLTVSGDINFIPPEDMVGLAKRGRGLAVMGMSQLNDRAFRGELVLSAKAAEIADSIVSYVEQLSGQKVDRIYKKGMIASAHDYSQWFRKVALAFLSVPTEEGSNRDKAYAQLSAYFNSQMSELLLRDAFDEPHQGANAA